MGKKLEICCYSAESAIKAEQAGAHRIELCDNFTEGGTTPSYATIKYCVEKLNIPVNVIVRPRGGDFLYSEAEFEIIKEDVLKIKELGANGVVIGFLTPKGKIDLKKTKEIIDLAAPLEITFHRAFDMCRNHLQALEELKSIGIKRILTSGSKNNAFEGSDLIKKLVEQAKGKIIIMPGSGINQHNLPEIIQKTGAKEFHTSAKTFVNSKMEYFNPAINMGRNQSVDEYKRISVNSEQIKMMARILNQHI